MIVVGYMYLGYPQSLKHNDPEKLAKNKYLKITMSNLLKILLPEFRSYQRL
jgi:hypothetical protein